MPCKKGMSGCRPLCRHREFVRDYRLARDVYLQDRESESLGYSTEEAEYDEKNEAVTFKWWLMNNKIPEEWR